MRGPAGLRQAGPQARSERTCPGTECYSLAPEAYDAYKVQVQRSTTHVTIDLFERDGIVWQCYDFPGQLEHQASNSFFLSTNAVVLLVIDISKYDTPEKRLAQLIKWLSTLISDRKSSRSVIVVGSHADLAAAKSTSTASDSKQPDWMFLHEYQMMQLTSLVSSHISDLHWHVLDVRDRNAVESLRLLIDKLGHTKIRSALSLPKSLVPIIDQLNVDRSFLLHRFEVLSKIAASVRMTKVEEPMERASQLLQLLEAYGTLLDVEPCNIVVVQAQRLARLISLVVRPYDVDEHPLGIPDGPIKGLLTFEQIYFALEKSSLFGCEGKSQSDSHGSTFNASAPLRVLELLGVVFPWSVPAFVLDSPDLLSSSPSSTFTSTLSPKYDSSASAYYLVPSRLDPTVALEWKSDECHFVIPYRLCRIAPISYPLDLLFPIGLFESLLCQLQRHYQPSVDCDGDNQVTTRIAYQSYSTTIIASNQSISLFLRLDPDRRYLDVRMSSAARANMNDQFVQLMDLVSKVLEQNHLSVAARQLCPFCCKSTTLHALHSSCGRFSSFALDRMSPVGASERKRNTRSGEHKRNASPGDDAYEQPFYEHCQMDDSCPGIVSMKRRIQSTFVEENGVDFSALKVSDFKFIERLGKKHSNHPILRFYGTTAAAYRVRLLDSHSLPDPAKRFVGREFAIRFILNYADLDEKSTDLVKRFGDENRLQCDQKRLPWHDNVVHVYHSWVDQMPEQLPDSDWDPTMVNRRTMFALMGVYPLNLASVITSRMKELQQRQVASKQSRGYPAFHEREVVWLSLQMAMGLEHLHRHRLVHRDFKPDNVLLARCSDVKLESNRHEYDQMQFDWSVYVDTEEGKMDVSMLTDAWYPLVADLGEALDCERDSLQGFQLQFPNSHVRRGGAPSSWPPEILHAEPGPRSTLDYSKTDAYALGKVMQTLMAPVTVGTDRGQSHATCIPSLFSECLQSLVRGLLNERMEDRISLDEAVLQLKNLWCEVSGHGWEHSRSMIDRDRE